MKPETTAPRREGEALRTSLAGAQSQDSALGAAAHRAMAKAALFSDSSARTRLKRYNQHMDKARTLEAAAGAGGDE